MLSPELKAFYQRLDQEDADFVDDFLTNPDADWTLVPSQPSYHEHIWHERPNNFRYGRR